MNFEKKVPDWENVGAEPDSELKKGGFKAGYKPPAAYFNWFFNRISESVKELQNSLRALAFKDTVSDADITDVTAGKVKQDSTHRMITDTERTSWNDANAKKHTHSNKTVLDKVTQALLDNWSTAFSHVSNKSNPHGVTKSQIGLGNVDNTSDADKPVSTAQHTALDTKVSASGGDIADTKVGSITASTASYPVPAAGDTVKVGFGKITKFFTDIKNWMTGVCLIGSIVNNCVTNNAKLPLSAAQGKVLMDLYTVLNTNSSKVGHAHDERYYTEAEIENKFICGYQAKSKSYTNQYIAKNTWTYIGPTDITITPGLWLITYSMRISATSSAIKCSIRSTLDSNSCQSVITDTKDLIMSMELTELAQISNTIYGLYPQFYTPVEYTFSNIIVKVSAVKLR